MKSSRMKTIHTYVLIAIVAIGVLLFSFFVRTLWDADNESKKITYRTFETSFESITDFTGFYIVPPHYKGTSHELSSEVVHSGNFAHKAWVYEASEPSTVLENNNHRGYPTIQFQKTPEGAFECPCYIDVWVWVDGELKPRSPENEWLSFATFTSDETDDWNRTVLVNLSYDGFVHLMHVPNQGESERIFQTTDVAFPKKQWVKLTIFLDMDSQNGYAKVWQDNVLVSHAEVDGGNGKLAQAHFGLYGAPSASYLIMYNDDLTIREVDRE